MHYDYDNDKKTTYKFDPWFVWTILLLGWAKIPILNDLYPVHLLHYTRYSKMLTQIFDRRSMQSFRSLSYWLALILLGKKQAGNIIQSVNWLRTCRNGIKPASLVIWMSKYLGMKAKYLKMQQNSIQIVQFISP